MKKSQLKKIIRESIKELMNEQTGPPIPGNNPTDPACMAVLGAIHPGPPPVVSQTFINNMTNKPCNFYNNRLSTFYQNLGNLMTVQPGGAAQPCLIGDNPSWQVQIRHKINYIQNNFGPGTSMNCTPPPK
jgi:hypothetical protein